MFINVRELTDDAVLEADVCIVGAGLAGLTIAREFFGSRQRVLVLEAGSEAISWRSQWRYRAEMTGAPNHAATHSRFRAYGGSGTRWTGQCVALDAIDFEGHSGAPGSGWPFDLEHLRPWYARAGELLGLEPLPDACNGDALPFTAGDSPLVGSTIRFARPNDVGATLRAAFAASSNVDILLDANVVDLLTDEAGRRVTRVSLRTAGGAQCLKARARHVVLATGGIENPRLLLAASARQRAGFGNEHGLVGRYFHDHPYLTDSCWQPSPAAIRRGLADGALVIDDFALVARGRGAHAALTLDPELRRREGLSGCVGYFIHREPWQLAPAYYARGGRAVVHLVELLRGERTPDVDLVASMRALARDPRSAIATLLGSQRGRLPGAGARGTRALQLALRTVLDVTPRADSRVTLDTTRDACGVPRARVDWRITDTDWCGAERFRYELSRVIEQQGLGTLVVDASTDPDGWPHSMDGGKHHLGATRMHTDPARGVVDANACVHGMDNLYIAGSSVFPTSGWANPTFTILALATRLADHLRSQYHHRPP